MKRKHWILLFVLLVALWALSGCGVPREGADVANTPPSGWWQTLVVWPLAKALLALYRVLADMGTPYPWGFAIILFTLIIRVILFPLTLSQIRGMQAQRELQPKLQALQKKYGKNREKLAQEQMKLYQEAGVNPLSGCLPLLIQMPILFGLYSALVALGPQLEDARFFWIPNLGFPRFTEGLGWIPRLLQNGEYGTLAAYLVLPVLLIVSQFYMQKMTTAMTPSADDSQAGMMKQMTLMMTLMFGFFTLQVPAGLTLYWVTSNLLQMAQQMAMDRWQTGSKALPASVEAPKEAPVNPNGADTEAPEARSQEATSVESTAKSPRPSRPARSTRRRRKRK